MAKGEACAGSMSGVAFTKEDDAIILDLVPKGRVSSAAVRLRRNRGQVARRYDELTGRLAKRVRPVKSATAKE